MSHTIKHIPPTNVLHIAKHMPPTNSMLHTVQFVQHNQTAWSCTSKDLIHRTLWKKTFSPFLLKSGVAAAVAYLLSLVCFFFFFFFHFVFFPHIFFIFSLYYSPIWHSNCHEHYFIQDVWSTLQTSSVSHTSKSMPLIIKWLVAHNAKHVAHKQHIIYVPARPCFCLYKPCWIWGPAWTGMTSHTIKSIQHNQLHIPHNPHSMILTQ